MSNEFEDSEHFHMKRLVDYLQHLRVKDGRLDRLISNVMNKPHHRNYDESRNGLRDDVVDIPVE